MTSHSKRIRVTLPELECARLSWLAAQAGLDVPTEAAMLLIGGIRRATDGWRRLLGAPGATVEELDRLLARAAAGEPDEPRGDRTRDIEHSRKDTEPLEPASRLPTVPEWEQDELPYMPDDLP